MDALAIAGWRSLLAALFMAFVVKKEDLIFSKWSIIGSVAYSGTVILFVIATKLTTAANAILIQYTAPIYVALLSKFVLDEPILKRDWIIIAITFCGMLLFFGENIFGHGINTNPIQARSHGLGNVIAVFSGICFAVTVLALRKEKNNSTLQPILVGNILTALIALPIVTMQVGSQALPTGTNWHYLGFLGFIQLGFGYLFFAKGTKLVSAIEASLVPIIEPILNPIWVAIFYNEYPSLISVIGGLVVIFAVSMKSMNVKLRQ